MPSIYPGTRPYVAAKFDAARLPERFDLGDENEYGGYSNRPLDPDAKYRVFLRAITVDTVSNSSSDWLILVRCSNLGLWYLMNNICSFSIFV